MKVKNLKAGLQRLIPVLEAWEAKKVVQDFQKLIELMGGHEDMSVASFCNQARRGLEGGATPNASSKLHVRQGVVDDYVSNLNQGWAEDRQFKRVIKNLGSDKQVRLIEMKAIATGFIGHEPTATKKQDILSEITSNRAKELRTKHKLKILSDW